MATIEVKGALMARSCGGASSVGRSANRSPESEARHILECAAAGDLETRRRTFLELVARLRHDPQTQRAHTPSDVLIREDRDGGHRL